MVQSTGWVPVESRSPRQRVSNALITVSPAAAFFILAFSIARIAFSELPIGAQIAVGLGAMAAAFTLAVFLVAIFNPAPRVEFDRGLMRVGTRTVEIEQIDIAMVVVAQPSRSHRAVGIRFGKNKGLMTTVILRDDDRSILTTVETDRLTALLELTDIRMPTDPYDPLGKFARYNFPTHIDRAAAVELVRHPPGPSDALPIPEDGRYPRT